MVLLLTFAALLLGLADAAPPLEAGRERLRSGDVDEALKAYREISPTTLEWREKIEDLARFHLGHDQGEEAWRVLQVGRRVGRKTANAPEPWRDLERLAIYQAGACPLALPAHDMGRGHLLAAAVYRFRAKTFLQAPQLRENDREIQQSFLAPGLVPYLGEIPKTRLLKNQGCRLAKQSISSIGDLARAELGEILDFLDSSESIQDSTSKILLVLRALELSSQKPEVSARLRSLLPGPTETDWRALPDPERQWLFVFRFGGKTWSEIASENREEAQKIALDLLMTTEASPLWLSVINRGQLKAQRRDQLLTLVLNRNPSFDNRGEILMEAARTKYELGRPTEALRILRRLLVEKEESVENGLEDEAVQLSSEIFSEYRFDQKTLGALEAALPSRLWRVFLTRASLISALQGRAQELSAIEKLAARRNTNLEIGLLRALARRDLSKFKAELRFMNLEFAKLLAGSFLETPESRDLTRFTDAAAERLRLFQTEDAVTQDLIQLLTTEKTGWNEGQRTVRAGVVRLGVSKAQRRDWLPPSFTLKPPVSMVRRDLFFVPDLNTERGWKFSVTPR